MTTRTENLARIPKVYNPSEVEGRIYKSWMDNGYFKPRIQEGKQPFVIIMPPPNVTGELHLGHALTAAAEDALIRWHRMMGDPTLWLPGSDHAGIATRSSSNASLSRKGKTGRKSAARPSSKGSGSGSGSTGAPSLSSTSDSAPPATGPENDSPSTRAPAGPSAPPS